MKTALLDIVAALTATDQLDNKALTKIINKHNKRFVEEYRRGIAHAPTTEEDNRNPYGTRSENPSSNRGQSDNDQVHQEGKSSIPNKTSPTFNPTRPLSKKKLMEYYLAIKREHPEYLQAWGITPEIDRRLIRSLQMKPRRTASGVATITVLTKPWKCSSDCLYCPNDLRMPKSYLADEPACQRAERNFFDPYLQVSARLRALNAMGHITDKVELIVLGGTWSDYPQAYQIWFVRELFRALNDATPAQKNESDQIEERSAFYQAAGLTNDADILAHAVEPLQHEIAQHNLTYNKAFDAFYKTHPAWCSAGCMQQATLPELYHEHQRNETADHRVVGLVIETRPDNLSLEALTFMRALGCTKIQMGIQSLDETILRANRRSVSLDHIQNAFEACRLLGFKTHVHAMVNLYGSNPELDKRDYQRLVTELPYQPDEIKLYPCVLIEGTHLCEHYRQGTWQPYNEETLVDILVADTCATPPFTRISRMIRDFSAPDIMAGNKKVNLRQMVEECIDAQGLPVTEIRRREISLADTDPSMLRLDVIPYTTSVSDEYFLQWITPKYRIAGFLRLSLPHQDALKAHCAHFHPVTHPTDSRPLTFPIGENEAMIREVHVYGRVAGLHVTSGGAQHQGLGTQLVEKACQIARDQGYHKINVISAIGTRGYYRKLQFYDNGLYQQRDLS